MIEITIKKLVESVQKLSIHSYKISEMEQICILWKILRHNKNSTENGVLLLIWDY